MYNLELVIGTILLLIANNVNADEDGSLFSTSANLALESIKDAELASADVSDLVSSFNMAVDLMNQADKSQFDSCSSYEDCNEQAIKIFVQITNDARLLKEQAEASSIFQKLMTFIVYAPITAFATSVVGYCSFKAWRPYRMKRFLEMDISEKEK